MRTLRHAPRGSPATSISAPSMDSSFDFGFNVDSGPLEGEATRVVTESERLTWADIESERRNARADVETVAASRWVRALSYIARLKAPALQKWSARWLTYCTVPGHERPVFHAGKAGEACREVELQLARLGIVDPNGFNYGSAERRAPRKRKFKGAFRGVAGQLEEYRERMRGPWIG